MCGSLRQFKISMASAGVAGRNFIAVCSKSVTPQVKREGSSNQPVDLRMICELTSQGAIVAVNRVAATPSIWMVWRKINSVEFLSGVPLFDRKIRREIADK